MCGATVASRDWRRGIARSRIAGEVTATLLPGDGTPQLRYFMAVMHHFFLKISSAEISDNFDFSRRLLTVSARISERRQERAFPPLAIRQRGTPDPRLHRRLRGESEIPKLIPAYAFAIIVRHIQERFLSVLKFLRAGISENTLAELSADTGQVPTILVVVIDAAEMQDDAVEASEISSADRMRPCGGRMHHFFLKLLGAGIAENLGCPR